MPMESFWEHVEGIGLRQGDFLPQCQVPLFHPNFGGDPDMVEAVAVHQYDLIILTQSCDLENRKASLVALCPIFTLRDFEEVNPGFMQKGEWEKVRKGRVEGLHLLCSVTTPEDNRGALVVDFKEIYSLPFRYLEDHVTQLGQRWRLKPPYLEHFSQSFARFFMRVGLPSSIPPYK